MSNEDKPIWEIAAECAAQVPEEDWAKISPYSSFESINQARYGFAKQFYEEVCREAESNMLKTGKLEGSHFAAMQRVLERWQEAKTE